MRFMNLFRTLLTRDDMRMIFLGFVSNSKNLPLVQGLFGAPPYTFLAEGDGWAMRAGGLALGRVHLTYDHDLSRLCPNYMQFGYALWTDEWGRHYTIVDRTRGDSTREWLAPLSSVSSGSVDSTCELVIRLPKYSTRVGRKRTRTEDDDDGDDRHDRDTTLHDVRLMQTHARRFPMVGDVLNLKSTSTLRTFASEHVMQQCSITVRSVRARESTALLWVKVRDDT